MLGNQRGNIGKGQVSMEFMAYIGFLLIMFAAFGPFFLNQSVMIDEMKAELKAERVATLLEREFNTAVRFGDGYSRNFTLPSEISSNNYSIELHSDLMLVEVQWGDRSVTRQITSDNFKGSPVPGKNHIRNSNSEIIFNQ